MQLDDARSLIAAVGNLAPELQAAGRRRVAERIAAEGVVDLAAGRVYRFKHGWIPLTHAAALRVTHGNHEKASALLAKHHGPDGSHTARVTPSKHGGFNVTHRGELQAHWNSEADAVKHAAKLNGGKASGARVTPSAHGGFNVIHKGQLQGNHTTQAGADRHAAKLNTAIRPKARTSERTLASRQPAAGRDKATPPRSVLHSGSVKPMDTTAGHKVGDTVAVRAGSKTWQLGTIQTVDPATGRVSVHAPGYGVVKRDGTEVLARHEIHPATWAAAQKRADQQARTDAALAENAAGRLTAPQTRSAAASVAVPTPSYGGYGVTELRSLFAHPDTPGANRAAMAAELRRRGYTQNAGTGKWTKGSDPGRTSADLNAAAAAKRAEAERIANGAGIADRAAGRLSGPGLAQAHRSTDAQLRRYTEATAQAGNLEHSAGLAAAREREAARTRLTHEQIKGATHVKDQHGTWREVVRVNPKSVTVTTGHSWNDSIPHDKVHGVRTLTPAALQSVLDNPKASEAVKAEARRLLAKGNKK